ncbi:hypothetical protein ILYODFUR_034616 [Ilyodon furcidens]|uniref:Uncharacterized protein n=1 Tax=Ilyodon furcidens TaxID=33524 RepID=A0ABV0SRY2_9TELE
MSFCQQRDISALTLRSRSHKEEQWKRSACWRGGALIHSGIMGTLLLQFAWLLPEVGYCNLFWKFHKSLYQSLMLKSMAGSQQSTNVSFQLTSVDVDERQLVVSANQLHITVTTVMRLLLSSFQTRLVETVSLQEILWNSLLLQASETK